MDSSSFLLISLSSSDLYETSSSSWLLPCNNLKHPPEFLLKWSLSCESPMRTRLVLSIWKMETRMNSLFPAKTKVRVLRYYFLLLHNHYFVNLQQNLKIFSQLQWVLSSVSKTAWIIIKMNRKSIRIWIFFGWDSTSRVLYHKRDNLDPGQWMVKCMGGSRKMNGVK